MIVVNRKGDRITGAINGTPFNVPFDEEKYSELKLLAKGLEKAASREAYDSMIKQAQELTVVDFKEEVATANGFLKYRKNTGKYYLVYNKGTKKEIVSDIALPDKLAEMIVQSHEEGADFMPLVLAWARFISNPKHRTKEMIEYFGHYLSAEFVDYGMIDELMVNEGLTRESAEVLATYQDLSVTDSGLLATNKVVEIVRTKYVLDKDEKNALLKLIDMAISKKKLKDNLSSLLSG